jgi:hypothetical protein
MGDVRERWLSGRAVSLHFAILVFVPGCAIAAWWQINRAAGGNQLSYLYSVLWPAFAILSIYFWWMLIHTDFDNAGMKGVRRQEALAAAGQDDAPLPAGGPSGSVSPADGASSSSPPPAVSAEDDPALAAYNARLAELAAQGPKTWRARESVVVRREQ